MALSSSVQEKLDKMRALANDPAATEGERQAALRMIRQIEEKYDLEHRSVESLSEEDLKSISEAFDKLEKTFGKMGEAVAKAMVQNFDELAKAILTMSGGKEQHVYTGNGLDSEPDYGDRWSGGSLPREEDVLSTSIFD